MESENNSTMSRLAQIQAKFQQKQLQEREKKKTQLTTKAKVEAALESAPNEPNNMGNGKVRQMFDERRRGAGIDRSNLLKPIAATTSVTKKESTLAPPPTIRQANGRKSPLTGLRKKSVSSVSASFDYNQKTSSTKDLNQTTRHLTKLSLCDASQKAQSYEDLLNNNSNKPPSAKSTPALLKAKNETSLKPVMVKKSPTKLTAPVTPNSDTKKLPSPAAKSRLTPMSTNNNTPSRAPAGKINLSIKPPPRIVIPQPGMATCRFCSRNFNSDRLAKHEEVCGKMNTKKRKIFDATKQRVKGTEAEIFVKRSMRPGATAAAAAKPAAATNKKSDWRRKHEEFIAAIRNAKKVQAYIAKGGKISDLPPPPVSENPDYIQCPHCLRRFNQAAAERHIPKCATMKHNKPKPAARK